MCADLLPGSIFSVSNSYLCAWIQAEVNLIAPYVHLSAPSHARIMLVGEQPGDQEDRAGEPFVGPAGRVLDDALSAAGIDRGDAYVTNAVKHFKWKAGRGKRRLHQRPDAGAHHMILQGDRCAPEERCQAGSH